MKELIRTKRIDNLKDINNLLNTLMCYPEIKQYVETHELVNGKLFKNDCYEIRTEEKITVVYLVNETTAIKKKRVMANSTSCYELKLVL